MKDQKQLTKHSWVKSRVSSREIQRKLQCKCLADWRLVQRKVAAKLDVETRQQDANLPSVEDLTPPKANRPFKKVGPVKFAPGKPKSISPRKDKLGESRFDPSENPNAEADQEFDKAANALRDAGIAYKALKRIGSLNREKDIFKIDRKDMRKAREVMQGFPNTQIKRA